MSGAFLDVVADRHRAQADDPGERRLDLHLREPRLGELQPTASATLQVVLGFVLRLARDEVAFRQVDGAIELGLRERQVRARLLRPRPALIAGSSRTSIAPLATGWPSWNRIALMRPATSGRSVTDSSERRLPTAVIVCGSDAVVDLDALRP